MSRLFFILIAIFLSLDLIVGHAATNTTLRAANGAVVQAKINGKQIVDSASGTPLPNGIYLEPNQTMLKVKNGMIVESKSQLQTQSPAQNLQMKSLTPTPPRQLNQPPSPAINPSVRDPNLPKNMDPTKPSPILRY